MTSNCNSKKNLKCFTTCRETAICTSSPCLPHYKWLKFTVITLHPKPHSVSVNRTNTRMILPSTCQYSVCHSLQQTTVLSGPLSLLWLHFLSKEVHDERNPICNYGLIWFWMRLRHFEDCLTKYHNIRIMICLPKYAKKIQKN